VAFTTNIAESNFRYTQVNVEMLCQLSQHHLALDGGNRRMTRLPNAFSKKAENHTHMMAIYFMHYNFVRIHQTLKITPAMAANVTDKLWEMSDMVKVLEDWEASQKDAA
jgi:hypothetical protein